MQPPFFYTLFSKLERLAINPVIKWVNYRHSRKHVLDLIGERESSSFNKLLDSPMNRNLRPAAVYPASVCGAGMTSFVTGLITGKDPRGFK
jgi:hypothetical protein